MSYDLMVFEIEQAPTSKTDFLSWYQRQTQWSEPHDYQSIDVASPALQHWFMEMKETFPPLNGEHSPSDAQLEEEWWLEDRLTDFSIGTHVIYIGFPWSTAEEAYETTRMLAKKHHVGLFDVSGPNADVILPDGRVLD